MKIIDTKIPEVKVIIPKVFNDERGFFFESFNHEEFEKHLGLKVNFVQDNHSQSYYGVLRGLHYQIQPHAQRKLVRVIKGEIFDVAVDIRKSSPTFGKWVSEILSSENKKQIWIPEGFAHGFLSLSDKVEVIYKTDNYYESSSERSILWNDKSISIDWPKLDNIITSEKDKNANTIKNSTLFQ